MEKRIKTKVPKIKTPYQQYQNTEEWVIIANLLSELENNQDIELKTAPEYVVGYLVEKLRNKDLSFSVKKNSPEAARVGNNRKSTYLMAKSKN
ncbi:MAG: hypothetical protein I3273_04785 [Candidatus Moeniiplasma glomeromycotorum]|nr:hypothetical protein [Candidatus Moeniiplasma glomeromycotorum]MCE8169407.1 hypothetical protein [Candidatus Moeniiplasma glomeromycotorum]